MMYRKLLFVLIAYLASLPIVRTDAQTLMTIDQCVRVALEQDLQRQIADLQWQITGLNHHGSVAGRYPNVSLNTVSQGNLNDQNNPASFLNGLIRSGNANISLDAT